MDIAFKFLVIAAKTAFIAMSIFAFVTLLGLVVSAVFVVLNMNVLGDIFSLVQMWLPFNLSVILLWILTASTAYIVYRVSLVVIRYLNAWLND